MTLSLTYSMTDYKSYNVYNDYKYYTDYRDSDLDLDWEQFSELVT